MKNKNRKIAYTILLTIGIILIYFLWISLRPVKIISVHQRHHFTDILVNDLPFTDSGKITWWLKNKDMLKIHYGIPKTASWGGFNITFWKFGDGYKEEGKYDRLCFSDMKTEKNCIEKDPILSIYNDSENRIYFTVFDGDDYLLQKNGKIVKYEFKGEAW